MSVLPSFTERRPATLAMLAQIDGVTYLDGGNYPVNRWWQQNRGSTFFVVARTHGHMGRRRINAPEGDKLTARFREGTLDRVRAVLGEKEKLSDFIREAVEDAVDRREGRTK
ncbi:hypothetical protein [Novosphingobium sp. HII-3]|uniref:hypothetical protein n=1 Tax=Novosphingobium sp. HII-3 TaxID=2075565 RepID=UPI0011AED650|nr:hypothetical protein [Novosphingobium sp. HII-3]